MKALIRVLFCGVLAVPMLLCAQELTGDNDHHDDPRARADYELKILRDPVTGMLPPLIRQKELKFAATLPSRESSSPGRMNKGARTEDNRTISWSQRGPANVGGRTRALAIDVAHENILLAGGVSGGMWRSVDAGTSWSKMASPSSLHSVTCIAQDTRPGHQATWYYGSGEAYGNSASEAFAPYRGDGIFKSTDDGITWAQLPSTISGTPQSFDQGFDYVWNVVTDPSNMSQSVVLAATFGAIERSSDGGATWTTVLGGFTRTDNNSTPYSFFTDISVTSGGIFYATMSSTNPLGTISPSRGYYRSADGVHWIDITPGDLATVDLRRTTIGVAPSNESVVYFLANTRGAGQHDHSLWKYTYLSGDGSGPGGNWDDRSLWIPGYGPPAGDFSSQGSYDLVVKVKPDDENVVYIGGTNLYRSTDGFFSPTHTAWIGGYAQNSFALYANHHPDQHAVVFSPSNPMVMFSGDDGGVQKTINDTAASVVWIPLNNGYVTGQFYSIAVDHATPGNDILIGGLQDNGSWFTNSPLANIPWSRELSGDGTPCAIADGRTSYYLSSQFGRIYRFVFDDFGNRISFTRVDPTNPGGSPLYNFVNPFILDPTNTNRMFFAGGDRVWRNNDLTSIPLFSNSTTSVNWNVLTNTGAGGGLISALGMSRASGGRLYVGKDNGHVIRVDSANIGDPSATDITGVNFPSGGYVISIAVDPSDANKVLVAFSNYSVVSLFYSADSGSHWTPTAGNLEQFPDGSGDGPSTRWVCIAPPGGYYVATSTGVYSTPALSGASTVWLQEGSSTIGNVAADMVDARLSDGLVVVATHGNGVYSGHFPVAAPDAPLLVTPADSATNQSPPTKLIWSLAFGAETHHLQLSTAPDFSVITLQDSSIIDTSLRVNSLSPMTTYFWRVRAHNAFGWSPFSSSRRFTTGELVLTSFPVRKGWNMVSVPLTVPDSRRTVLFPTSTSGAYEYNGSYVLRDTLTGGSGQWLRFGSDQILNVVGFPLLQETVAVVAGWNMIGSVMSPLSIGSIASSPPGIVESFYFGFNGIYAIADSIDPGRGYWVKVNQPGKLILNSSGPSSTSKYSANNELDNLSRLIVRDALGRTQSLYFGRRQPEQRTDRYDLPPLSPARELDVRFASNKMVELADGATAERMAINISFASYPLNMSWEIRRGERASLKIGNKEMPLNKNSSVIVSGPDDAIVLKVAGLGEIPASFSLEQNYPNPFNPSTEIRYALMKEANVSLRIFNVLGELVTTLVEGLQTEGYQSVRWDAKNIPSGMYYYRLEAVSTDAAGSRFVQVRKMLFLK